MMIRNAWGILYATFSSLITAIQCNRDATVLGMVSIFYALARTEN